MAVLADEQKTFLGSIGITRMPTHGTCFTCVVSIDLDCHTPSHESFIGNHALQFRKRPLGISSIGFLLLFARPLALLAFGPFSDVCQLLQTDQTVWMPGYNALGDRVIGVGFQPSLSSADRH